MNYYMGIDAGGTKCEALICNENAEIIADEFCYGDEVESDEINDVRGKNGKGRSFEAVNKAFKRAYDKLPDKGNLYITNNSFLLNLKKYIKSENIEYNALYHNDESEAIYNAANVEKAYFALVGTGAFAYYLNGYDRMYFDGLGPHLGDYGGGFSIGLAGARAAGRSEWAPEYRTSLAERINEYIAHKKNNSLGRDIVNFFYEMPERNEVAFFAKMVSEEAEKGDRVCTEILQEAGRAMGNTMRCLIKYIRPCEEKLPIICNGSIITKCRIYQDAFIEYCREHFDNEIKICSLSSVYGLVMNSVKQHGETNAENFYNLLLKNVNKE